MKIEIKPMETEAEVVGKGRVQFLAWKEAYSGIISDTYLDKMSEAECVAKARRYQENTIVAKDGERVVGFAVAGRCVDAGCETTGEIYAIYTLREHYGKGIGFALMNAALERLLDYGKVVLWVLSNNQRAIDFYLRYGFEFDGVEREIDLEGAVTELRMVYERKRADDVEGEQENEAGSMCKI